MEEKLVKAIELIKQRYNEEFGEDAQMDDGEEIVGVFNDCTIKISLNNSNLEVAVTIGEAYKFDEAIFEEPLV